MKRLFFFVRRSNDNLLVFLHFRQKLSVETKVLGCSCRSRFQIGSATHLCSFQIALAAFPDHDKCPCLSLIYLCGEKWKFHIFKFILKKEMHEGREVVLEREIMHDGGKQWKVNLEKNGKISEAEALESLQQSIISAYENSGYSILISINWMIDVHLCVLKILFQLLQ